ncbi:MAG: radical SAM protein [Fimbriimonadaceae bacterium]|nr:radical SAM protein [Fimbriimonadaceae bacterium]QYK56772.1 MAG: radical SAM protein [Fimbriimonadaceae bacterium]
MSQFVLEIVEESSELPSTNAVSVSNRWVGKILHPATGRIDSFDYSLNPYVGCAFACSYCYAAFFVSDDLKAEEWGKWVEVKRNALGTLRRERHLLPGAKILLGSVTDCYQPLEARLRLTRSLLEEMVQVAPQPKVVVQTRSPLVERDIDLFRKFTDIRVNMTVTTDDDEVRRRYEPSCASIERRLAAITMLKQAGIQTGLSISPVLPVRNPERFAEMLRATGADKVTAGTFHVGTRKFASGTRPGALALAEEDGWTAERARNTILTLQRLLPNLRTWEEARRAA